VFNEIWIPVVPEAGRKLAHDPDALLDLSQQQSAALGSDGPAVELSPNLSMLYRVKSEDKLVTLCAQCKLVEVDGMTSVFARNLRLAGKLRLRRRELINRPVVCSHLVLPPVGILAPIAKGNTSSATYGQVDLPPALV